MRLARTLRWQNTHTIIPPQIRADGVHVWPFDPSLPVAVTFQVFGEGQPVRMNRHDYFEIAYVLSGEISCQVAGRSFRCKEGELIVIGSSLYHRMWRHTRAHPRIATIFFMPEVICEAGSERRAGGVSSALLSAGGQSSLTSSAPARGFPPRFSD